MAQTIRRTGKGVRRTAAQRNTRTRVDTARRQTGSLFDAVMRRMPLSEATLGKVMIFGIIALGLGAVVLTLGMVGVPAMVEQRVAMLADQAGYKVKRVEVRGLNRMNELTIYEKVLSQRDQVMSRLDLAALRADLLTLPWVKDARVSRQLPDTLVVDVVERSPHAVLKQDGHYVLIDETGHPLETVPPARARGLMALAGHGVTGQVATLDHLLEAAPALKTQVAEAEWVGNRRWNLTFRTGQVLALPEGEDESAAALVSFARMDGVDRLLGGKVAAFDMRVPDRIYLRVPGHAEAIAAEARAASVAKAEHAAGAEGPAKAAPPVKTAQE